MSEEKSILKSACSVIKVIYITALLASIPTMMAKCSMSEKMAEVSKSMLKETSPVTGLP